MSATADRGGGDEAGAARRAPEAGRRRRKTGRRGKHYHVTVTPEEHAEIDRRATIHRRTIPHFLVESAMAEDSGLRASAKELDAVDTDVMWVLRQLGAIGNNLNQIAKVANSTGQIEPGLEPAIDRINELSSRVRQTVDAVDGLHR